jgi:hypothetical protein
MADLVFDSSASLSGLQTQAIAENVEGFGNEVITLTFTTPGANTTGNFTLTYGFPTRAGTGITNPQSVDVDYDLNPDNLANNIQNALAGGTNSIFGTGSVRAWVLSTYPDGSANQIQLTFLGVNPTAPTASGQFAGASLLDAGSSNGLRYESRSEVQQITFSNITSSTAGFFIINNALGASQQVDWNPDPTTLLATINARLRDLFGPATGPANAVASFISPTLLNINFGAGLVNQNIPDTTIVDQLVNGWWRRPRPRSCAASAWSAARPPRELRSRSPPSPRGRQRADPAEPVWRDQRRHVHDQL